MDLSLDQPHHVARQVFGAELPHAAQQHEFAGRPAEAIGVLERMLAVGGEDESVRLRLHAQQNRVKAPLGRDCTERAHPLRQVRPARIGVPAPWGSRRNQASQRPTARSTSSTLAYRG